jgi:O-methyltransferase involved in polyketide biosynthesis
MLKMLTPYLPDEATVVRLLSIIAKESAPGSLLGFDTVSETFLTSMWTKGFVEAMATKGIVWNYGMEHPEKLLATCGFEDIKVVEAAELNYRPSPYPHIPRLVPGVPRWFMVTAKSAANSGL